MWFGALGPLEVREHNGELISVGPPQRQKVLLTLLLYANKRVNTDAILQTVWGSDAPQTVKSSLQAHISRLRGLLGAELIRTTTNGYLLRVEAGHFDVDFFEELISEGNQALRSGSPSRAADLLSDAISLWRGVPYSDLDPSGNVSAEVARLEELHIAAHQSLIDAELSLGNNSQVIPRLEALVADHPYNEGFWSRLMVALYREDRQAEALRAYDRSRELLLEDLGLEPSPGLQEVADKILTQDPSLIAAPHPPRTHVMAAAETTKALVGSPAYFSSLVGRDREASELVAMLDQSRLVTIVGTGGVGKTRMAAKVASSPPATSADTYWVDLSTTMSDKAVISVICQALGLEEDTVEAIATHLSDRDCLLVLDNCEQVIDAASSAAYRILTRCPGTKILSTSRAPLGIAGEDVYRLPPLEVPDQGVEVEQAVSSPAVALFLDRARSADRAFEIKDRNVGSVVQLCQQLDGLPLAIELAAAQLSILSLEEIVQEVDRIVEPIRSGRGVPARHRTIASTLDWSCSLLDPEARVLYRRLSVFPGGADIDMITKVCSSVPDLPAESIRNALAGLVELSLLTRESSENGKERYRQLNVVRSHGHHLLNAHGETEAIKGRLATYMAGIGKEADNFRGPEQAHWLDRIDEDVDNLIDILLWASEHQPDTAVSLASNLGFYWVLRGRLSLGRSLIEPALEGDLEVARDTAGAYLNAGILAGAAGDFASAEKWFTKARDAYEVLDDKILVAAAESNLGIISENQGNLRRARELLESAFERIQIESPDDAGRLSSIAQNLASVTAGLGDVDAAREFAQRSLELAKTADDLWLIGGSYVTSAVVAYTGGRVPEALDWASRSKDVAHQLDDPISEARSSEWLAAAQLAAGDFAAAVNEFEEALRLRIDAGDANGTVHDQAMLARAYYFNGQIRSAAETYESIALSESLNPQQTLALLETAAFLLSDLDPESSAKALRSADRLRSELRQPAPSPVQRSLEELRTGLPVDATGQSYSNQELILRIQQALIEIHP